MSKYPDSWIEEYESVMSGSTYPRGGPRVSSEKYTSEGGNFECSEDDVSDIMIRNYESW
jgi:hypothetical protein